MLGLACHEMGPSALPGLPPVLPGCMHGSRRDCRARRPQLRSQPGGRGGRARWAGAGGRPAPGRPVVLVTGASHGIGLAAARLLAAHGYQVFGASRKPGREDLGGVVMLPLDVTSDESARSCVADVLDRAGRIDVLINNAGVGLLGAAEEIPLDQARALYEPTCSGPRG